MKPVLRRALCGVATFAVTVTLTFGCSEEPDKQTEKVNAAIREISVPDIDCNYGKDLAPIVVTIEMTEDPHPSVLYLLCRLDQVSGNNIDWHECIVEEVNHYNFNGLTKDFELTPPSSMPDGVYSVKTALFTTEATARVCIIDNGVIIKSGEQYAKGVNCQNYVKIQYDCQNSHDIRYGKSLENRLKTTFGEASDLIVMSTDNDALTNHTFWPQNDLITFLGLNWFQDFYYQSTPVDIYLAGVEDISRAPGFYPGGGAFAPDVAGFSGYYTGVLGDRGSWSLVLVEYLRLTLASGDIQEQCLRTATHELGHARAALHHPDETSYYTHEANFDCAMDGIRFNPNTNRIYPSAYWRFCSACRSRISSMPWP